MAPAFEGLRSLCRRAVADDVVPAAVVHVGAAGRTLFSEAFGRQATTDTVFDVASLTKALITSVLAMRAVTSGKLSLDEALPGRRATLRQALAHASGLPAHRPLYERAGKGAIERPGSGRAAIVALAAAEPLEYEPGERSIYSDLGFIVIGDLLERVLGDRLDGLAAREIFAPLSLHAAGFVDLTAAGDAPRFGGRPVAPTERCPVRGRVIEGEVHDLNAFAMGGIAGHAGLFATAADVAAIAHALCAAFRDAGPEGGRPFVSGPVLRAFFAPAGVPGSSWRLGWDGPAATESLAGRRIDRRAVGHLGFTGCSLWIDPERETFVVVLSNRVHPVVRDDPRFRVLRSALNDAALEGAAY